MAELSVVVASLNPVKVGATMRAFERAFPGADVTVEAVAVPSGVADQPMTDAETLQGAANRASTLVRLRPDAHFHVGIEGGVERHTEGMDAFAWVVIRHDGRTGRSRSCSFELPAEVTGLIDRGVELGDANDWVFKTKNSKTDPGAVGILSRGLISRTDLYEPAVVLALIPFMNADASSRAP
jgi:inosine/xanthosine triphosphatase